MIRHLFPIFLSIVLTLCQGCQTLFHFLFLNLLQFCTSKMKKLRWNWRWRRWITQQCRVRFPMRSLGLELGLLSQGLSPEMWHCSGFRFRNLTSLNLCFLILKWGEAHFVGKVCLVRALIFVNPLAVRLWRLPLRQWCWGLLLRCCPLHESPRWGRPWSLPPASRLPALQCLSLERMLNKGCYEFL